MKKSILLVFAAAALLCACNKSTTTPEQKEEPQDVKVPQLAKVELIADFGEISSELLKYYKITYNLTDHLGKTQSYDITGPQTIKMTVENPVFKNEEMAYKHSFELLFTRKDTAQPSDNKCEFILNYEIYPKATYPNGEVMKTQLTGDRTHLYWGRITWSSVQEYLGYLQQPSKSYGFFLKYYEDEKNWRLGYYIM